MKRSSRFTGLKLRPEDRAELLNMQRGRSSLTARTYETNPNLAPRKEHASTIQPVLRISPTDDLQAEAAVRLFKSQCHPPKPEGPVPDLAGRGQLQLHVLELFVPRLPPQRLRP